MASIVRRTSLVWSAGLAVLITACSSSNTTAPTPPSASAEALHIDSLFEAADAAAQTDANYGEKAQLLEFAEIAPAYGGAPSYFTVDLNGTKQTWTGTTFEIAEDGDSTFYTVLWDDANADNILWTAFEYESNTSTDSVALIVAADTIAFEPATFTTAFQRVGTGSGATCTEQSGLQNTDISNFFGSDEGQCSPATFSGQVTVTTTVPAGAEAGLGNLSYSNSHQSGEYFYDVTDPARVPPRSRLAKMIKAYMATVRARQAGR